MVLGNAVAILLAIVEGNGVDHKMIVQIVRIEVCGDKDLVVLAPHPPRGLNPDRVRLLRRQLARLERLEAVVRRHLAALAELFLNKQHFVVSVHRRAVDSGNVLLFVGLVVALGIFDRIIQIVIQILPLNRLIRIVGIFQQLLEIAVDRPESRGRHLVASFRQNLVHLLKHGERRIIYFL